MKRIWSILLLVSLLMAPCTVLHAVQAVAGDLTVADMTGDAGSGIDCIHQNDPKSQSGGCEFDCNDWRFVDLSQGVEASTYNSDDDASGWKRFFAISHHANRIARNGPQKLVPLRKAGETLSPLSILHKTVRLRI